MSANLALTKIKLGDSATPANNFLISVPDIADGTLTIEREDGTDVLTIDAAGKVVFPGNVQTWQDVKASRAVGTTYTNNTGQSITVMVSISNAVNSGYHVLTGLINGQNVIAQSMWETTNAGLVIGITMVVPNGATYSAGVSATDSPGIQYWWELR